MKTFTLQQWVWASFFGWFIGIIFILALSGLFDVIGLEGYQFYVGLGIGAGIGLAQWWVLKKAGISEIRWIGYTALGLGLPFLAADLWNVLGGNALGKLYLPLSVLCASLSGGFFQQALVRKYFERSAMYIGYFFIGLLVALLAVSAVEFTTKYIASRWLGFFLNLFLILMGGLSLGLSTGFALKRLKQIGKQAEFSN